MLLWYVALAVPTLVSVAVGVLTIVEHFSRRGESAKAASLGGYVTHTQLNGELAKIYEAVKTETRALTKELKGEFEKLDKELGDVSRTANQVAQEVANIEGRLDARRRPS